jgi:hypothetical protein
LDEGKTIVSGEKPAPMVELSSKTKKILLELTTKRKTKIGEKKRKKQRFGRDAEEIVGSVPKVTFELPQELVGEIIDSVPEVIVEVPKEKVGELEKTHELRVKSNKKLRANEGGSITQSSTRNTRSTQEEQVPAPIAQSSSRNTRSEQAEQVLVSPPESSRIKMNKAQDIQSPVPIYDPKKKKRRLFKDEISILVSTTEEVSGPIRRTTQSMDK